MTEAEMEVWRHDVIRAAAYKRGWADAMKRAAEVAKRRGDQSSAYAYIEKYTCDEIAAAIRAEPMPEAKP